MNNNNYNDNTILTFPQSIIIIMKLYFIDPRVPPTGYNIIRIIIKFQYLIIIFD